MAMREEAVPKKARYIMVGSMILIVIGVFLYMLKKVFEARRLYLKEEEDKSKQGYAKLTILEEQEDIIEDNMAADDEDYNINTDFHQECNIYKNFIADDLWMSFLNNSKLIKENIEDKNTLENTKGAQLKATMYYQVFAKYLKIHLTLLENLTSYDINKDSSIKLKVMVCNTISNRKLTETTKAFPIEENIDVNVKMLFKLKEEDLKNSTLYVSMLCEDIFFQEYLLGAVSLDLGIANYRVKQPISEEIIPVKKDRRIYGYLLISLCHVPCVERLVCVILSGRDLKVDLQNKSILDNIINPYVKISLLNDGKLTKHFKTKVMLETNSPSINEMFEFYINDVQLMSADILFMVMHKDSNHSHQTIGKLLIGNHGNGDFYKHWEEAISNPECAIARWHPIMKGYH